MTPIPYSLTIPEAKITDLKARLALTRFPDQAPDAPWAYGADLGFMKELVEYWQNRFDWRAAEARLNAFPNYMVEIDGTPIHFLHVPGKGPNPKPLFLSHGWPGSVFEFLDLIPRLTDPAAFGGDPADAVTVVAPSLPGFGLSFRPGMKRLGFAEMSATLRKLMTDVLGYERYGLQGGDWGAFITTRMAVDDPDRVIALHLNMLTIPAFKRSETPTEEERAFYEGIAHFQAEETGYFKIQATKPQTLAFALTDSPAGLAAWIVEKFRTWTDCDGDVLSVLSMDQMLEGISFYWFTEAIGSSFWLYYARQHGRHPISEVGDVTVPMGFAAFPKEISHPPRAVAELLFKDIRRWSRMERGGHFAAMEQPAALAAEVTALLRDVDAARACSHG